MKVLKKANPLALEKECTGFGHGGGGCLSLLLVEWDDIQYYAEGDDEEKARYSFTCPECFMQTDIPSERIPNYMKRKIKRHSK